MEVDKSSFELLRQGNVEIAAFTHGTTWMSVVFNRISVHLKGTSLISDRDVNPAVRWIVFSAALPFIAIWMASYSSDDRDRLACFCFAYLLAFFTLLLFVLFRFDIERFCQHPLQIGNSHVSVPNQSFLHYTFDVGYIDDSACTGSSTSDGILQCLDRSHDFAFKTSVYWAHRPQNLKIRIAIRPKTPDIEKWSITTAEKVSHIKWAFRKLSLGPAFLFSPVFVIGKVSFYLELLPRGVTGKGRSTNIAVWTQNKKDVHMRLLVKVLNRKSQINVASIDTECTSSKRHPCLSKAICCSDACVDETLGYLEKGWFTMQIELQLLGIEKPTKQLSYFGTIEPENRGDERAECLLCETNSVGSTLVHKDHDKFCRVLCAACARMLESQTNALCPSCLGRFDGVIYW